MLFPNLFWPTVIVASTVRGSAYHDAVSRNSLSTLNANINAAQQPNFTFDELFDLQRNFLDHFIYPANVEEVCSRIEVDECLMVDPYQAKKVNSTILAEDCLGRVDITRTFAGRELNTEYLFGLFANLAATPGSLSLLGVPVSYKILHFAANQNIASAATLFQFNFTAINTILPVRIDTWNSFNAQKQISQYDATFVWWDWAFATLLEKAAPVLGANSTAQALQKLTGALASSICNTAMTHCNGENAQYSSPQECVQYLTKEVRFGAPYELGMS